MANYKGSSNFRNFPYSGKQSLLPPKSPFPSISPAYADYSPSSAIGTKGVPKPREGLGYHHPTSSESFLIEEQPSWVEELLNEPETPVGRGHRRSSSDSFAYLDAANASNVDNINIKNITLVPLRGSQDFDHNEDVWKAPFYSESNSFGKQDQEESGPNALKGSTERGDCSHTKPSESETDPKRAKQQFAQRSRVRKLQYIAELERNVQTLQVEGSEVSAELKFLDQQSLILRMENKTLKHRLDSLAQEQVIKYLEQEMLEREIRRLQALYQQQQQPPPLHHTNSRDLDSRFANLSLKHKEARPGHDPISSALHT